MSFSKPSTKTKAAELERMRNNQRRSRERRKEYLAELEQKIRRYESSEDRHVAVQTVQQLRQENDTLKKLLQSMGLGNDFLKSYISASAIALQMPKTATPSLQLDEKSCCRHTGCSSSSDGQLKTSESHGANESGPPNSYLNADPIFDIEGASQQFVQGGLSPLFPAAYLFPWDFSFDSPSYTADVSGSFQLPVPSSPSPVAAQAVGNTTVDKVLGEAAREENTTLCSIAYSLVMMSNRKGYNATDLDIKLRAGYRPSPATFEGCRIENAVLLSVLAEIL